MPSIRVGEAVPREVADARAIDATGAEVRLGSFWEKGPAIVLFVRHFGCVGCAEQVTELAPQLPLLARAGVRTVLVGNGSTEQRAAFVERQALEGAPIDVLTDPSLATYHALGLRRSVWATIGPRALVDLARAMTSGQPHRSVQGDAFQQGGALVVDAHRIVRLYARSESLGDHVPAADLTLLALRLAVEDAPESVHI